MKAEGGRENVREVQVAIKEEEKKREREVRSKTDKRNL